MPALSPWKTAEIFGREAPTHVPAEAPDDAARLRAYETYEDLYTNQTDIFAVTVTVEGGNENYRRFIPSARTLVEATNRYLARGLDFKAVAPAATSSTGATSPGGQAAAGDEQISGVLATLDALFTREEFGAKFLSLKRWALIRGDALLHITADESKPQGTRLRIVEIAANTYFALEDPADSERVIGCYLINIIKNDDDEDIAARLEYRKAVDDATAAALGVPLGSIFVKLSFYETDGWDDRRKADDLKPVDPPARFTDGDRFVALLAGMPMDPAITSLPVYHFRNKRRGGSMWGTSEIQGLETLIIGINQTTTDEEVSVALAGIGVYATDSGRPVDDQNQPVDWVIAPASIVELETGKSLTRVQGVTTVQPMQDHISLLDGKARESSATPDIAVGRVDGASVASGVALAIQMAPMVAKVEEAEEEFKGKLDQFLFDLLTMWLPAFEGFNAGGVVVTSEFADPLPKNIDEIIKRAVDLVTAKIASAEWARGYLADQLGLTFASNEGQIIADEAEALMDATGAQLAAGAPGDAADPGAQVGL